MSEETHTIAEQSTETDSETNNGTEPGQNIIEVQNPTAEEMKELCSNIQVNYDFAVNVKPTVFNFKKSKDKDTGVETIRKPVELAIPYPSVEGILKILETGGKQLELLMESVEGVVNAQARDLLYDDEKLTAAEFPTNKVSWEYISNLPKAQRRGGGIAKTTWDAFTQDYLEVMPTATGKSVEQVTNAAKILGNKLNNIRTNEPVLNFVVEQLALYAEASPNVEEYQECVEFLLNKAETYLNTSEEQLLANL